MTDEPKPKRGRPKVSWDKFDDELWRRLTTGEACETVEAESKELAKWAKANGICTSYGTYLKHSRIRERIKKRYNGSLGYRQVRKHKFQELIQAAKKSGLI